MPINNDNLNPLDSLREMEDFDNVVPVQNYGQYQQRASQAEQARNLQQRQTIHHNQNYSGYEAFEDAKSLNRISYAMEQYKREKSIDRKAGFFVSNDMLKENNVPFEYWDEFNGANSPEQFSEILTNLNSELQARERLTKNGGLSSFGWEATASVTDPIQLLIGVATGGVGAVAKGGTLAKLGSSYAIGAAEGAITGSLINQGLHTYTVYDVIAEAGLSGLFSAGVTGVGLGIKKAGGFRTEKQFEDWKEIQEVNQVRKEKAIKEGEDIDYTKEVNIQPQVLSFKEKAAAFAYRQAIEDNYFNTDEMVEIVDTWQGQIFKLAEDADVQSLKVDNLRNQIAKAINEGDDVTLRRLEELDIKATQKYEELVQVASKAQDEFEAFQTLSPIEQIGFVGKKQQELFGEINPEVNMRSVVDDLFDEAVNNDYKSIRNINQKIELLTDEDEINVLTSERDSIQERLDLVSSADRDAVKSLVRNEEVIDDSFEGSDNYVAGSVGAAKTRNVGTNFDTYSDEFDIYDAPITAKQEQEMFDDVGENVNNSYPAWMINLMTNQEKLNVLGGSARRFGELIYGRIAQKQKTSVLQKEHYGDLFLSPKMGKVVDQFSRELGVDAKKAEIIGRKVLEGVTDGLTPEQVNIANKFNENTIYWFQKYNSIRKIPVEIEKQFIQREFGSKFQNMLEKSVDGKTTPLAMAYNSEFGARATRNAGLRSARYEMNKMLSVYHLDEAKFKEKYPDVSDEFLKSIDAASQEMDSIYKEMAQRAINVGLDDEGILQEALASGGKYMPRSWDGARFNQAQNDFGLEPIYDLFQDALEQANGTSRFSRKAQKEVLSGKIDEVEAEAKSRGKSMSRIISEALVNHAIARNRNQVGINPNEMRVAFEKALSDINKFISENYDSIKGSMDDGDFKLLQEFAEAEADSFKSKQGLEKHKQSRIEIDVFFEKQMERRDGEIVSVSISDFMDLNAEKVAQSYLNTFSSHVAFAKAGIKSLDDLNSMIVELEQHNNTIKDRAAAPDATKEDIRQGKLALSDEYLQFFKDNSMQLWNGTSSIDYNSKLNRFLQYLGNYNFMRMMGKMGISQMSELSEIAHQGGVTTMFKSMPTLSTLRTTLRGSKGADEARTLAENLELFGIIGDNHNSGFFNDIGDDMALISIADYDSPFTNKTQANQPKLAAADDVFHKGSRYAGLIGSKMDKFTRTWAVQGAYSELDRLSRFFTNSEGDVAWNKRQEEVFSKRGINKDTLIEYGLTLDELPMIKEAFDKYATFDVSKTSGNRIIKSLDFKAMIADNNPAFEKLRTFAIQAQNEVVAPSTIGNSYKSLVDNQIMKTFFQFRSYPLQSLDHKLRNKLRTNNNVSAYLLLGAFTGFVSYSLNTLANATKYENADEYLADRFSMSKVLAGSYSRSVYAYFFPAILGSIEETFIGSNVFDQSTRTTGLSQSIFGNPTGDLINNAAGLAQNTARYASGVDPDGMTKALRNAISLAPFAAAPIIGEGFKVIGQSGKTYEK